MVLSFTGSGGSWPVTVTVIDEVLVPDFAVIVAVPAFLGVTTPFGLTVATSLLDELQLTDAPFGSVVAVSCLVVTPSDRSTL